MSRAQEHLAQANGHIAELKVRIVRQRVIVKYALDTGQRSEIAESLLDARSKEAFAYSRSTGYFWSVAADRLDTELLMRAFLGWLRGEKRHCSMVAIPTVEEEDARRPNRERGNLVTEQTRIVNQIKAVLTRFGIRTFRPTLRKAEEQLEGLRTAEGAPLLENTRAELRRYLARLPDEQIALLPLRCVHRARRSRQLQHGCVLAFAQPGEQHGLPVGELQRIVVHRRVTYVDLPEPSHFPPELHLREKTKSALVLDFLFERDLRAG
jgi:hypothetical protein